MSQETRFVVPANAGTHNHGRCFARAGAAAVITAGSGGYGRAYLFSTEAGAFWSRQGFREVPVPELVAALPDAPQVRHYDQQGWLPDEVAWRKDL